MGRRAAELGRPFFGGVVAHDPYVADDAWPAGIERTELDDVFATSDLVSLHVALTAESQGLVDRHPGAVRDHSYLVNVSRGGLVDHDAPLAVLDSGKLAGAGLHVLSAEPPQPSDPLLSHPNVFLSCMWRSFQSPPSAVTIAPRRRTWSRGF